MTGIEFYWPGMDHVPIPEPMTVAIEMECPDWQGLGHVPISEPGEWVSPTQSTVRESEGVEEDQNSTRREYGQERSQNDRRLLYHLPASRNLLSCRGYRNIKVIDLVHY